ncbi:MAG: 3'-5' exonuclease, partial [Lachnospiraceae bacterium]|nr:3'-5' exonuclease [Lachnospiraceae bacterium]
MISLRRRGYETALDDITDPDAALWTEEEVSLVRGVMDSFRQKELVAICRDLYKALMGLPDPFDRLDAYIDDITRPSEENKWAREIQFAVDMDLLGLEAFLAREEAMICADTPPQCENAAAADAEILTALMDKLREPLTIEEKYAAIAAAKDAMPSPRVTKKDGDAAKEWNEGFKALRAGVKGKDGILGRAVSSLEKLMDRSQAEDNLRMQRTLRGLAILLRATAAQFRAMKLEHQGIDYSDMEQMVYELVKREDIRESICESITDIYVDECQDVSAIQYAIIDALTGGDGRTVCRVGDIKQSIYGFRSAAPDLMDRDISAYENDEGASRRKIFFQQNYRSCSQIIECVNEVFDASMDRRVSEIDYTPNDHLKANVEGDFGPVKTILLARDEGDPDLDMLEAQCEAAGKEIAELITDGGREYRDIVILVQNARNDAPVMVEHFRKMHIPVLYDGGLTYYGLTEISSFLSLLAVIDNDHTDVELVGALRNVPFSFSDEDLARIREAHMQHSWYYEAFRVCCERNETELDRRCAAARDRIRAWREEARSMSASEFIWRLMRESGIYAVRGAYPDGKLRQMNLDSLYQRAVDMEKRGIYHLSDFLSEIGKLKDAKSGDTGDTPAAAGEGDNFVRLMTMHKSKGLEFPVVILMNLQKD